MKTILLINDGSTAVLSAAKLTLQIARDMQAEILIVQTYPQLKALPVKVLAGSRGGSAEAAERKPERFYHLFQRLSQSQDGFQPAISMVELPQADAPAVASFAQKAGCWLIVRGCGKMPPGQETLDYQSLLNRLHCPLLLMPERWDGEGIHRMTYMADLRYCRLNIMRYLARWATASRASLSLAHFSKEGLVPIVESYGVQLFADVARQLPPCSLSFNNIREPDIHRAVDILINGLHTDLIALINHRFHFEQLIGNRLTDQFPPAIGVPLLLFPM
ncbi:universal stress protein [Mucilaginibacter aquariorum]|uniref:Universal stress protein n=1 Tax=Mucilaginibacter aquariorum TaxID=2967225 RepID=A0ABT1T2K9_9SPHI|nr:universal stress protein [Mucilaginibacter aquariorum]MCQ6958708.1 universal stress protein [Mucilaginibacter aquariorum]